MLSQVQLQVLQTELQTDSSNLGYRTTLDPMVIASMVNQKKMVLNPSPQGQIKRYNLSGSSNSCVSATDFLNAIPPQEIVNVVNDSSAIGRIFFDRLTALEAGKGIVDLSSLTVQGGVQYCAFKGLISQTTLNVLIGTTLIPDPNWQSMLPSTSRADELGLPYVDWLDVLKVLKV